MVIQKFIRCVDSRNSDSLLTRSLAMYGRSQSPAVTYSRCSSSERCRSLIGPVLLVLLSMFVAEWPFTRPAFSAASSPSRPFAGYSKYLWYRTDYEINGDGTYVETHDWARKVLDRQGIEEVDRTSIDYRASLQEANILAAYTLKSDGRRIDVPAANFQEEINRGQGGNPPIFSDITRKTIAFANVGVGDTVVIAYRIVQKTAIYPRNFSDTEFPRFGPV
jgi:hypothetical protein